MMTAAIHMVLEAFGGREDGTPRGGEAQTAAEFVAENVRPILLRWAVEDRRLIIGGILAHPHTLDPDEVEALCKEIA